MTIKTMIRLFTFLCILIVLSLTGFFIYNFYLLPKPLLNPQPENQPVEKPLDKYQYANLKKRIFPGSEITLGETLKDNDLFISKIFYFTSEGKKVSGLANIPKNGNKKPVIVTLRGYIDREIYQPGIGTQHAGEVFAANGFITLAPDFLGYGESASPSANVMEERFETYTTVMNLLSSIKNLSLADPEKIGIWAHSNGGQIALSVLEISGKTYPTVLWAPVSKPFPYSILYYTDDIPDHGKALRKVAADFEKDYDSEKYSYTNYFDLINAPIQLHQGTSDDSVPVKWSNELFKSLKDLEKEITYYTYPGADHNMTPGWDLASNRSLEFFRKYLINK